MSQVDAFESGEAVVKAIAQSPVGIELIKEGNGDLNSAFRRRREAFIALLLNPMPETIQEFSDSINNLALTVNSLSGMLPATYAKMIPTQNAEFQDMLHQYGFVIDINVILNFFSEERLDVPRIINYLQALPADNLHELELSTLATPVDIITYLRKKVALQDFSLFLQELKERMPKVYAKIEKAKIGGLLKENANRFPPSKEPFGKRAKRWFEEKVLNKAA